MSPSTSVQERTTRAFVALELDSQMRDALLRLVADIGVSLPGVRWVRPDALHLTLRFLGDARDSQLERLAERLRTAAGVCPPSQARVAGLGMFPDGGSPRVLWIGIRVPTPILALQQACERAAREVGFAAERRPFRPHLTLARWRDRVARPSLPDPDLGLTTLSHLVLFGSALRPDGAVHTPFQRHALGSAS